MDGSPAKKMCPTKGPQDVSQKVLWGVRWVLEAGQKPASGPQPLPAGYNTLPDQLSFLHRNLGF